MDVKILPSLLAADVGCLAAEARRAEDSGADELHLDIMDAHFVPNLSMGPTVVEMARRTVKMPLSVHLMMTHPNQYLVRFIDAGADSLLIHIESECDVPESLRRIRDFGVKPGITLNPETPAELVFPVLPLVDEVLVMTVRPGYGGQAFMAEIAPKIRAIRKRVASLPRQPRILVDGGIDAKTIGVCAAQGADSFVAGTALYRAPDMKAEVARLRRLATDNYVA